MAKKKKRVGRPRVEYEIRIAELTKVDMHVSVRRRDRRDPGVVPEADAWIKVHGQMDEPIEGQSEIEISIHGREEPRVSEPDRKSVGTVVQVRPYVHALVDMPAEMFDRTWTMVAGKSLTHVWISMTKPMKGMANVVSVSFTNQPIE
jgi:hypothetical protein